VIADYGGIGAAIADMFHSQHIPIVGIKFGETEKNTGKNFKNAMFNFFKLELKSGRIQYPNTSILESNKTMRKHFNEWCILERRKGIGMNDIISAPHYNHDDGPCADVMAVWGMDKDVADSITYNKIPLPKFGVRSAWQPSIKSRRW
jgi:hypothetical protein